MILVDYIGASKQDTSVYEGMEADPGENLIVGIEEGKLKLMYDALCLTGSSDIGETPCSSNLCGHKNRTTWVQCSLCHGWFHCRCVMVPVNKAEQSSFVFVCPFCKAP